MTFSELSAKNIGVVMDFDRMRSGESEGDEKVVWS